MKHSEKFSAIASAILAAQQKIPGIAKDAKNTEFGSRYVTLDALLAVVRPILHEHNLAILQGSEYEGDSTVSVETILLHGTSGEWLSTTVVMPVVGRAQKGGEFADPSPQSAGSAITYGRRYGIAALLCIASDEDDDGNSASRKPASRAAASPPPARPAEGTASPTLPDDDGFTPDCPKCAGPTWDNRLTKRNPKAPDYKCRDRSCDGVIWPPREEKVPAGANGNSAPPHSDNDLPF